MIVPHGINRPLSSCLFNVRAHTGLKSLTREHEGTLTQTELAIIMQIPLLGVSVLQNFGAVTADRALRSRLFRVGVWCNEETYQLQELYVLNSSSTLSAADAPAGKPSARVLKVSWF